MTMQIRDSFSYHGERAEAIAISKRFHFTPTGAFGIKTSSWATSNYRGFWCDYIIDDSLIIKNLYLFSENHAYPPINGKSAVELPEFSNMLEDINRKTRAPRQYCEGFPMQYLGINYAVDYTGMIVLGVDPKPNKRGDKRYRQVLELTFEEGILLDTADITQTWRKAISPDNTDVAEHWWEKEEYSYFMLINYSFMGLREANNST